MIIDITTGPGEELSYEQRRAIIDAVRGLGHTVDFLDHYGTYPSQGRFYVEKLRKKGTGVADAYLKRTATVTKPQH